MMSLFRRYVVHNFWLKLLSVLLAVGLWMVISPDERPAEVALRSPIVFDNLPYDLEISSEAIPEAQIRVRGPERVIRQLRASDVHAEIELGGAKPGESTYDLKSEQVRHPRELMVVQVVPSQVHLGFDTRLIREVEIHPRVTGTLMAGEQIARVEVDPARITISGPKQHVEKVESATTDPVDASGTMTRATFVTKVYVSDPLVKVERPTPIHVTVIVEKVGGTAH